MKNSEQVSINFNYIYSNKEIRNDVYLPSSDTFTFVEALEEEVDKIPQDINIVLEMGSGSGYIILSLFEMLLSRNKKIDMLYCVDINKKACECIKNLTYENKIFNVEIIRNNLFNNIRRCELFDIVLFNPPYVITGPDEMNKTDLTASYAGGKYGREIIMKFLLDIHNYLSNKGVIYLLLEKSNIPQEILNYEHVKNIYIYEEIKKKKTLNETIFIYKLMKKK
ncbi:methyltransferase-like protein, putative [Plasmodium reichenowi]|uniref:Methyltransferase-like protein, putative n=1 Tax=Plasmodium reichenowi TaxID=5854 RepID=A0A2P9DME6_PLARE|nr:methyltransferase-like protein, putative [Plasmodium reichenowi]